MLRSFTFKSSVRQSSRLHLNQAERGLMELGPPQGMVVRLPRVRNSEERITLRNKAERKVDVADV